MCVCVCVCVRFFVCVCVCERERERERERKYIIYRENIIYLERENKGVGEIITKLVYNVCTFIQSSATKFLDTLSLHTCTSGQTTHQKGIWKALMNKTRPSNSCYLPWFSVSSPNGLADVHWLHIGQGGRKKISKERREIFMKGTIQDVRADFQVSIKVF